MRLPLSLAALRPARGPHADSLSESMLNEELRAERTIAAIRLAFYAFALVENGIEYLFLNFQMSLWPFVVALGIALAIFLELRHFWGARWMNYYYSRLIKYAYITADALVVFYLTSEAASLVGFERHVNLPRASIMPLAWLIIAVFFVVLGILRFSWPAVLYTGGAFMGAFVIFAERLDLYPSPAAYIKENDVYNMPVLMYFYTITSVAVIGSLVAYRLRAIMLKSKRQQRLERFLPEAAARQILNGDQEIVMGGSKQRATILFSDIRGFTTMAEAQGDNPGAVVDFLNTYFNDMIEIVFHYGGTLDKIMGDGIMAIYGAPIPDAEAERKAVLTAVDMHRKLADFNAMRGLSGQPPIEIGVGIHTGDVILGNIGSLKRMEFTAIGDTVNTASRLESYTKEAGAKIVISQATRERLNGEFQISELGQVALKGKSEKLLVYQVNV